MRMNEKRLVLTLHIQLVIFILFFRHVTRIAKYIKLKRPNIKLFIWHDMLSQLVSSGYNNNVKKKKRNIYVIQVPVLFFD